VQKAAKNRSAERWSGRLIADTILISPVGGREVNPLDGRRSIISILPVPKKLAQLLMDLARAGFVSRGGKGSHRNYEHPSGYRLLISVHKGEAKPYQQRDIEEAIRTVTKEGNHP
jgi:predicted RNA binding protein YcfA (HicA-like mRNA interferase family)